MAKPFDSRPTMAAWISGCLGVVWRDALIFVSYRFRPLSQLAQVVTSLTLFYYLSRLVHVKEFSSPDGYFASVVVGLVILEMLTTTLAVLPITLRQELVAGTFERIVLSPLGPVGGVISMTIFPFVSSVVLGGMTLVFAALVFGLHVTWSTAILSLPVAALASLAFAPFALLLAGAIVVVKQVGTGAGFIVTALSLVGGFFFPVALLPSWLRWASDAQPFTPTLELLRHLLVGTPLVHDEFTTVLKLALFAVVLLPIAVVVLSRAIGISQARGTITEY